MDFSEKFENVGRSPTTVDYCNFSTHTPLEIYKDFSE